MLFSSGQTALSMFQCRQGTQKDVDLFRSWQHEVKRLCQCFSVDKAHKRVWFCFGAGRMKSRARSKEPHNSPIHVV